MKIEINFENWKKKFKRGDDIKELQVLDIITKKSDDKE